MNYDLFNSLLDSVLVVDGNGKTVYANEAFFQLVELNRGRALKSQLHKLLSLEKLEDLFDWEEMKSGPLPYREVEIESSSGGKPVLITAQRSPFEDDHVLFYVRDLSVEVRLLRKYKQEVGEKNVAIRQAELDSLTQTYNRRAFDKRLNAVFEKPDHCILFVFDIDDFKKINDTHGHQKGDEVLRQLSEVVKENVVRAKDFFARIGGEEFAILIHPAIHPIAESVGERLLGAIRSHDFPVPQKVTVSLGVAERKKEDTAEELFRRADEASYSSKRGGKNQMTVAE